MEKVKILCAFAVVVRIKRMPMILSKKYSDLEIRLQSLLSGFKGKIFQDKYSVLSETCAIQVFNILEFIQEKNLNLLIKYKENMQN